MLKRPLCSAAVFFLVIQAFLVCGHFSDKETEPVLLESCINEGETVHLTGTVLGREKTKKYWIYQLTDVQIRVNSQIIKESKILVYVKRNKSEQTKKIRIGNKIGAEGEPGFFHEASNPGNFDQKKYYKARGVSALIWAETIEIEEERIYYIRNFLADLRFSWDAMLTEILGEQYGACVSAVLLGDKGGLDADLKELYQRNGIAHILAISGLHFSFIGYGAYQLLRKSGLSFMEAGTGGILFLLLYTILVGGSISCIRALVMLLVKIGADITGRVYDMPVSTALAALLIIAFEPLYIQDAGFLLSFGAVTGILLIYPVFEKNHVLPKCLCAGAAIQIVLLPILLNTYYEIPLYSLFLNLLVVPFMSVLLGAALAGSFLAVVWFPAGKGVLLVCRAVLHTYELLCHLAERLPANRIITGQPPVCLIYIYYVLLLIVCILSSRKVLKEEKQKEGKKRKIRVFFFIHAVLFLAVCKYSHEIPGEVRVTVVDVGQGDGIYIRTPNGKHCLVDGGSTDISEVGKYRLIPFLKSQGVAELEYIFISHGDADHISAVEEILEKQNLQIGVKYLVLPEEKVLDDALKKLASKAIETGTRVLMIEEGQSLKTGKMYFTCLAPGKNYTGEKGNAASMVLSVQYKEFGMLLTGDVEGEGEKALTASAALKQYDVLKVAHHGSKYSTTDIFLEKTRPRIALISSGRENRYGHPHEETLRRLEQIDCQVYNTQECGAVTIRTDGVKMEVQGFR